MDTYQHKILSYLFIALCAIIPWSLAGMQIVLGLICLSFLVVSIITKNNLFKYHPLYISLSVFLISLVVSAVFSSDIAVALDNVLHTNWIILTVPFIASLPLNSSDRERALKVLVFSAAIVGIYAIVQFFTGIDIVRDREISRLGNYFRATGTYEFYLTFAGNQLMIFALTFGLLMSPGEGLKKNRWYLLAMSIIGLSMIATFGRSSWIGAVVLILIGTYLFYRKYFWKIMLVFSIMVLLILISMPDIRERFLIIFDTGHQYNAGRVNLWHTSWLIFKDHPWLGTGPGLFGYYFPAYKVPGFYAATGHAHNDYLHMAVQAGILGFIAWLSIWITFFMSSYRYLGQNTKNLINRKIVQGVVLAISGILTAAMFQCYFVDLENSILWWVLVATAMQVFIQKNQETT